LSKPAAAPEPSVLDRIGTGMNAIRDYFTTEDKPKESVLQDTKPGLPLGADYDPAALTALSNLPRGRKVADELVARGKAIQDAKSTIGPIVGPKADARSVVSGLLSDVAVGAKRADAGLDRAGADLSGSEYLAKQASRKLAQADLQEAASTPEFESDTARGIYSGLSSTLQQAPSVALGVLTRNPEVALGGMVAPMLPQSYGKYRERGASPTLALAGAMGDAGSEYLTEKMPMIAVVNGLGKKGFATFASEVLGKEIPSEQIATVVQDAIDTAVANPDKTWGDYLAERPGAAYQTLVATVTQAGLMTGAHAAVKHALEHPSIVAADAAQARATQAWQDAFAQRLPLLHPHPSSPRVSKTCPRPPSLLPSPRSPMQIKAPLTKSSQQKAPRLTQEQRLLSRHLQCSPQAMANLDKLTRPQLNLYPTRFSHPPLRLQLIQRYPQ